jgi:hypothetical protein
MTMTKLRTLALLLGAALIASCGEPANQVIAGPEPYAGTRVRFFNFGVGTPGVHFYANDTKMAAVAEAGFTQGATTGLATGGTESTAGTVSTGTSGAAAGGYYTGIAPASYALNARTATDNVTKISTVTQTIASGKRYSFYISGIYDATGKTADAFVVEDPYSDTYDWTVATVRFVNASPNSQPMTLYAKNQTTTVETAVGAAIAYKGAGTFVTLAPATYDFRSAVTGATTNAITRTAVTLTAGKIYTITARGSITSSPALDNTANR